jgi:uncharacterized membrane protein
MRPTFNVAVLLAVLTTPGCAGTGPRLAYHEFSFTTIHFPGAASTVAEGINARGDIVGIYAAGGVTRGFLYSKGEFTSIQVEGAAYTEARGIGPDGEIVGSYRLPGEPNHAYHGYRRSPDGEIVLVNYPGHRYAVLQRILPDGTILGCRHDDDLTSTMRGIAISPRGNTETDLFASMHNGGTSDGRRIVGFYTNMAAGDRPEGYLIEDGTLIPLMFPESQLTQAWDINQAGDIVGIYQSAGLDRGFLLRAGGGWVSIEVPGSSATRAFGINPAGDIVGSFVSDGVTRGFVARRRGSAR